MENVHFHLPTRVYLEQGGIRTRLPLLKEFGRRVLVVTGRRFAFSTGLLGRVLETLDSCGINTSVFSGVDPEPSVENVENAAAFCRKHRCDVVLGLGGGSPMDVAKAVSALAVNPGPLQGFFGTPVFEHPPLPSVMIPTTCGTASEVTRYAVILDRAARTKKTVSSEKILPRLAILDPDVLVTLPRILVAATGMDAFCHGAESFLSTKANPLTRVFSLESVSLLHEWLPRALSGEETDPGTLAQLFLGSLLAGLALNHTGTILVHGMAYSLTVARAVHHGTANAVLLPYVLSYLRENGYREALVPLERVWGDSASLRTFIGNLGLATCLSDLGVEEGDLDGLADLCVLGCRRAVQNMTAAPERADFLAILRRALEPGGQP